MIDPLSLFLWWIVHIDKGITIKVPGGSSPIPFVVLVVLALFASGAFAGRSRR